MDEGTIKFSEISNRYRWATTVLGGHIVDGWAETPQEAKREIEMAHLRQTWQLVYRGPRCRWIRSD